MVWFNDYLQWYKVKNHCSIKSKSTKKGPFQKEMNHCPTTIFQGMFVSFRAGKVALEALIFHQPHNSTSDLSQNFRSFFVDLDASYVSFRECI